MIPDGHPLVVALNLLDLGQLAPTKLVACVNGPKLSGGTDDVRR